MTDSSPSSKKVSSHSSMGKAKHPHDASRPASANVRRAVKAGNIEAVKRYLTVRQRHFAEEYVVDYNKTKAAERAGYSPSYADRMGHLLSRHEGIAFYIDHLSLSKAAKLMETNPDYVLRKIVDIIEKEGVKDGDALRGLELIGRHHKMFTDKQEISGPDGKAIEVEQKTREEADSFVENLRRTVKPDLKVVGK
jgi:phage terminase small subunit